jgi:hypothetical protein
VVLARLDEHPNPLVVVPGRGAYAPRDGATVSDVVRAAHPLRGRSGATGEQCLGGGVNRCRERRR